MDLSCLGDVEKLYYKRNGKFEEDDWKNFIPDRMAVEKLKSRLLRVRKDEESSNLSIENAVFELEPNDENTEQRVSSKPPRRHSG